jgi:BirA family biotin operon repressor/biotin-[acetyl-CoA-carboxylase] ligase
LVQLRERDPPAQTLSLAAGLALVEAIDLAAPPRPFLLKWPNDVVLQGKKLAGILLERSSDRVAIGFGVNLATAPTLADRQGASLDGKMLPQAFAPLVAASFTRILGSWRQGEPPLLAEAWLARAHPVGTSLTVHASADEAVSGRFDGIEADGALRLRRDDGSVETVRVGDVEL